MSLALVINNVSTEKTGTTGRKLESLNGERKVLIISIIYKEAVVDGLLQTFGAIALRYQWASLTRSQTFFNTSSLRKSLVVNINIVYNNSPLSFSVDSP